MRQETGDGSSRASPARIAGTHALRWSLCKDVISQLCMLPAC